MNLEGWFGLRKHVTFWQYLLARWQNRHVKRNTEWTERFIKDANLPAMRRCLIRLTPEEMKLPHEKFIARVTDA